MSAVRKTLLSLSAAVLFIAACQGGTPPAATPTTAAPAPPTSQLDVPPTAQPSTPPTDQPSAPPTTLPPIDLSDCETPTEDWESFCQSYQLIQQHYVDERSDDLLSAAAAQGLIDFRPDDVTPAPVSLTCALPSDDFHGFCNSLAGLDGADRIPASAWAVAAIQGMASLGLDDAYSAYLSPEVVEREREEDSGEVEGIGALVSAKDANGDGCSLLSDECRLEIVGTIEGGPAEAAGLKDGDVIVGVDGQPIDGLSVDAVVSLVRGPAGTSVALSIDRGGAVFEVVLERAAVAIPIVKSELLQPGLGYLQLKLFTHDSPEHVRDALEDLFDQGANDVILDLQDNPGGTLDAAVRIASEFLSDGLVLRTEGPTEATEYAVRPGGIATEPDVRLVVLMNDASASASEVLAAALQESGRAAVIGEFSFGKNTVQQQFPLENGGALKLTIARWVTPDGIDYGRTGVEPDVLVPAGDDDSRILEAARAYLTGT
ncbi:MAG: S41 family peptidase [Acidimicrobiia bacterium]